MRIISISCLILAVAAAAGAQGYRPAGTGGAFYFGMNLPALDGISDFLSRRRIAILGALAFLMVRCRLQTFAEVHLVVIAGKKMV